MSFHPVHGTFSTASTSSDFIHLAYSRAYHRLEQTGRSTFGIKTRRRGWRVSPAGADLFHHTDLGFVAFDQAPGPISCTYSAIAWFSARINTEFCLQPGTAFNKTGSVFAYAVSYDWSKGYTGMTPDHPNKVMLHVTKDDEVKVRVSRGHKLSGLR